MTSEENGSLLQRKRATHTTSCHLLGKIIIDECGIELGGSHIRWGKGLCRIGGVANGRTIKNVVNEVGVSVEEITVTQCRLLCLRMVRRDNPDMK
jgi:hypothetical protein